MKVRDLIIALAKLPSDWTVRYEYDGDYFEVTKAVEEAGGVVVG